MRHSVIGSRPCGDGHPVFIVFEAGPTHHGFESARRLVEVAAEAGGDAIKFQILDTDRLMGQRDVAITYKVLNADGSVEDVTEPLEVILRRRELTRAEWAELKRYADKLGITFFATVDYSETLDFVRELGCHAVKVASGDLNHHPWLARVAASAIPVMIDTGSSTIGEIERAVEIITGAGNDRIIIHHCPSGYPARLESINLRIIPTLRQMFEFPIAFSDHTPGWDMDIAAVALGVNMVEKTLTLDRRTRSPEHIMSVEPHEAAAFVRAIRDLEVALGRARRIMSPEEAQGKLKARRSLFAARDLARGARLTGDAVDWRRPGTGITPAELPYVLGRTLARDVGRGTMLAWSDLA
ncbi:MAG: N-acetylneuraminate synthase [Elusimicrobia bacterium GWA2_69_24]|nr:MAG: N-acetylneuraminate synthase [Candidatus Rokubacteria bacterium GWC2_70_16]OGK89595.1 MAG: N-acetylneuraminate synthase [Candidatus Rokubacteria bacterium RBG_16_73_20]OGR61030.1 MAG: N-acetylneuraminate synthase [Elusimicrobia bacterium GWA2_69_24]HBH04888.1 N-acetylneuraminate synthase [Candidatus Rokubacteria bacterium]